MEWPTINSAAAAVEFLAEWCDLLAMPTETDPPLWSVVSLDGEFEAWFSDRELMDFARDEREIRVALRREPGVDSGSSIDSRLASSPANGIRARPVDSASEGRLVKNGKEVLNKMKSTTESRFTAFSVAEFIRAFRPDGLGHMRMEDGEGEEVFDVTFEEIVCDICNCEMVQPEDDPLKKVVFVLDGYALCAECRERIREDESPSSYSTSERRWQRK